MPIIGTPALAPQEPCCTPSVPGAVPPEPVSCEQQGILSAPISSVNRKPLLSRMRNVSLVQGQLATITWQLHDRNMAPIDLSGCGFGSESSSSVSESLSALYSVRFRMREHLGLDGCGTALVDLEATVTDPSTGAVQVELTGDHTASPGVYFAEFALVQQTDPDDEDSLATVISNIFYVTITQNLTSGGSLKGPPSIMEIRLAMRDSGAGENFLLDNIKFDDAEIAMVTARAVQYFNEVPPVITNYTTRTFPFRFHWLEAICGQLCFIAEEQFRANELQYSAGGVAINDQSKEMNYNRAGQRRWDAWTSFVRAKKHEINLNGCYGAVESDYRFL